MSNEKQEDVNFDQTGGPRELQLPRGVKLLRTLKGHQGIVYGVAFDPAGLMLASGSNDTTVKLWDVVSGKLLHTLEGHTKSVNSLAFDSTGRMLASASGDRTVKLWDADSGRSLHTLEGHMSYVNGVAVDPMGRTLASGGADGTVKLWEAGSGRLLRTLGKRMDVVVSVAFDPTGRTLASGGWDDSVKLWATDSGKLLRTFEGHEDDVLGVAFDSAGRTLASGSRDGTVKLWDAESGKLLRSLEGHTGSVDDVTFSTDGRLLASKSDDGTLRVWDTKTWETVVVILEPAARGWVRGIAFHPTLPLLAAVGSKPGVPSNERSRVIHFWELDLDVLLGKTPEAKLGLRAVHHTTAKIVLVGDSGVGKTGLGWRLSHDEFKEHASTHGQQFWVVNQLGTRRADGTECEAILWDLAGQPDYRLTHALFLDDADLALVLFDPTDSRDPLHGVEFWLKQLKLGRSPRRLQLEGESEERQIASPIILVGARADRGEPRLTQEELETFCRQRGIDGGFLATSALTGKGLSDLLERMQVQISWDEKAATVTTITFKRIKDYVLGLKENAEQKQVMVNPQDLRQRLQQTDADWQFTDEEMMTAVSHLANYGYVRVLRSSKGEERILLAPELLNNLAASMVLEARRNARGLGSLEEKRLLAGDHHFRELENLSEPERDILLDSAALLFLHHNVCFRETDLGGQAYLVFPELINLKKPTEDEQRTEDSVAYTVSGAVENVYASLVVLLGYTQQFTRTNQWQDQARYEVGDGLICGFRQEARRDGELDLVLYFGTNVGRPVRTLFQGLFESLLGGRNLTAFRYEPVLCTQCGTPLDRAVLRTKLREGKPFTFCNDCGEKLALPKSNEPIQLTQEQKAEVETQRRVANRRTQFEQAIFRVQAYVKDKVPECFVSYAWGDRGQERWVEKNLAADLQKAGIKVLLDKWENSRIGSNIMRFVERIEDCDYLIVVGTPLYRQKAKNVASETGSVASAEWDLAGIRMLATEAHKQTVLPVLLAGDEAEAFPALLRGRVYADFRNEGDYFVTAFDLILDLYGIQRTDTTVTDLRDSLRELERC